MTIEECQLQEIRKQEGLFSRFLFMQRRQRPTGQKGGDSGTKVLRRGRLGHGERFSTIVRNHRVIHYICNCVIVSGHFMQYHKASKLQRTFGRCCHSSERADSQGLSEPVHSCHQEPNLSLHFCRVGFLSKQGERFFCGSTLVFGLFAFSETS